MTIVLDRQSKLFHTLGSEPALVTLSESHSTYTEDVRPAIVRLCLNVTLQVHENAPFLVHGHGGPMARVAFNQVCSHRRVPTRLIRTTCCQYASFAAGQFRAVDIGYNWDQYPVFGALKEPAAPSVLVCLFVGESAAQQGRPV